MTIKRKISTLILSLAMALCVVLGLTMIASSSTASAAANLTGEWYGDAEYYERMEVGENDVSLIAMGDHQIAITNDTWKSYVVKSYEYIAQNKDTMNTKMYINLGDVFDVVDFSYLPNGFIGTSPYNSMGDAALNGANRGSGSTDKNAFNESAYTWQQKEFNIKMRTTLANGGVPNTWIMGNHDYEDMGFSYRIKETFNEAFPLTMYDNVRITDSNGDSIITEDDFNAAVEAQGKYFGGSLYQDTENTYSYFMGPNDQKYLVLNIGIHPDMDILDWANKIIEQNPNCFVIVSTHVYTYGSGKEHVYSDKAERLWTDVVTKHDNVKMILSGHSGTTNGGILKRVEFNDFGSPVYQFMIDSQSTGMGGAGVFAQMIFRENGDIDVGYYAPAIETDLFAETYNVSASQGKFFTRDSQFTFNYEKTQKVVVDTTGETLVGNSVSGSLFDKFYLCDSASNLRWVQNVYAYNNLQCVKVDGISVADASKPGYLVYHFDKPDGNVFKNVLLDYDGSVVDFANGDTAITQWDYSFDGIEWNVGSYTDTNVGRKDLYRPLDRYINGCEDLYIRFVLKADSNSNVSSLTFNVEYLQTEYEGSELNFAYDISGLTEATYDDVFLKDLATSGYTETRLSTGDKTDHTGGYGQFQLRFDSGDERDFETLTFAATMQLENLDEVYYARTEDRVIDAATREAIDGVANSPVTLRAWTATIKDSDKYAMKLSVSVDGGAFVPVHTEDSHANGTGSENVHREISPISLPVNGADSVVIKVEFFGIRASIGGFKTMAINGTYNTAPNPTFNANGGVAWGADETVLSKDGYVFEGWHLDTVEGEKVNPADYAGQNVSLVAKWNKLIRITYVLNGGVNSVNNKVVAVEGDVITLENATKDGAIFLGWYDANLNKVTTLNVGTNHIVLYAVWF